jgi:hypothetical protein
MTIAMPRVVQTPKTIATPTVRHASTYDFFPVTSSTIAANMARVRA